MIPDLKPYPAMKDSGVEWLGDVPEHWEIIRGKWLFRHKKQINVGRANTNVLSLTLRGVVNNDPERPEGLVPRDYATYQLFKTGDLVFKLIDLENLQTSRVGLVHEDGIMSSAYVRLIPHSVVNIRYFFQQYFDLYQRGIYNQLGAGVRSTLGPNDLLNLSVVVPPLPEQTDIVRFLDYMDRRNRKYICAKQKQIGLLEEQKLAIIHRAVTRGLDPNVPLKPSGTEWLGEVPTHWEVKPLKYVVPQVTVGIVIQPARLYTETGVPCLRSLNISSGSIRSENLVYISRDSNIQHKKSQIYSGDVVVVRTGQAGVAAIVTSDFNGANCIDLLIVRRSPNLLSDYLLTYLNSWPARTNVEYNSVGAIQAHYNTTTLSKLKMAVPPLSEQQIILDGLVDQLLPITESFRIANREIELLREYRTRLIADVVTGKLDVREAAAKLPEVSDEPEPLDIADDLLDEDDAITDELGDLLEEAEV